MNSTPYRLRVVCHDIMSLNNLGSIFRSADGAGFHEVVLSGICGTPPQRGLVKVSLGAEDHLDWIKLDTVDDILAHIEGDFVICCEQSDTSVKWDNFVLPATAVDAGQTITVIMGSEREGTDSRLLERADAHVEIPMRGCKESLNVAISFALIAYMVAEQVYPASDWALRGHVPDTDRVRREGVLTNGITHGQTPGISHSLHK